MSISTSANVITELDGTVEIDYRFDSFDLGFQG